MEPDDELCLCFHVTRRKVENFIRVERPRRVGQLSECFGAGTGCGWCRPFLRRLFEAAASRGELPELEEMTVEEYARQRGEYRASQAAGGTPSTGETPESS
jgi:NAD(P)H-nitrite reductase large subunit